MHVAFFTLLKGYKEVTTSHSKNYCRSSNFSGNQSEALNEMIDFFYIILIYMKIKCLIRFTKASVKVFISLVRDIYGMI